MDSWKYYADNADKDKFELIASANEGGPHVAFAIKECELGLIEVSYVMSYENFGELILCIRLFTCTLFSAILYYHNLIIRCYDLHEWLTDTGLALVCKTGNSRFSCAKIRQFSSEKKFVHHFHAPPRHDRRY